MKLAVGDEAPQFTLADQAGAEWSLAGHRGQPVVIYFFAQAETPGCTTQACDIRNHWGEFERLNAQVVGISPDQQDEMARFAGKYALPHRLLGDPDRAVIDAYGAWGEQKFRGRVFDGVIRSSVVVDAQGKVAAVFDTIQAKDQASKALAAVRDLAG